MSIKVEIYETLIVDKDGKLKRVKRLSLIHSVWVIGPVVYIYMYKLD